MNARQTVELQKAWGDRPCDHTRVEGVGHSGLEACSQCGRFVTRDSAGKPFLLLGPRSIHGRMTRACSRSLGERSGR